MAISTVILYLVLATVAWHVSSFIRNLYLARQTGLPMVISPISPGNIPWMIAGPFVGPYLKRFLPQSLYDHIKVTLHGWEFRERWKVNESLGPSWVLVSPGGYEIWTADPAVSTQVLLRRKDFLQLELASRMMSLFGPSITSSNGDVWQRHRRMIAPALNERVMCAVWDETTSQTAEMLAWCTRTREHAERVIIDVVTRVVSINVISAIAFGERSSWKATFDGQKPPQGYSASFIETLLSVVNHFHVAVFIPKRILSSKAMPQAVQKIATAVEEFPRYAKEKIDNIQTNDTSSSTLISSFAKLLRYEDGGETSKSDLYIHFNEIIGNLFNFTVAGFDSAGTGITYAFLVLALKPEWQSWIFEDIDEILKSGDEITYDTVFPRMTRCRAFMYEVLRLYTPISRITRRTTAPQNLGFYMPAGTNIFVASACVHVSPEIYSPDPLVFRPDRWLKTSPDGKVDLITPPKGTFLPWSEGPRQCPGIKMAQVEFVGIMWQTLSAWKIEVSEKAGESQGAARERLVRVMEDSQPKIALQLRNPQEACLKLTRR